MKETELKQNKGITGEKGKKGPPGVCPACGIYGHTISWDADTEVSTCTCGWSSEEGRGKQIELLTNGIKSNNSEDISNKQIEDKNCNGCLHFEACCKWTDFPKQIGFPVCRKFTPTHTNSAVGELEQIEEMARKNCHIEYNMKNYKTCKECYETNYCACRVYEACRNLYNAGYRKRSEDVTDINVGNKSEWISVDERLPEEAGRAYLVWDNVQATVKKRFFYRIPLNMPVETYPYIREYFGNVSDYKRYTHWMPLPTPPKEDKNA